MGQPGPHRSCAQTVSSQVLWPLLPAPGSGLPGGPRYLRRVDGLVGLFPCPGPHGASTFLGYKPEQSVTVRTSATIYRRWARRVAIRVLPKSR